MQDSKFGEHLYLTPRVPQGLAAAVEGLTREVIRHRPENIYAFAARHFENLLRLREQYDDDSRSTSKKQPSCSKQQKQLHEVNEAVRERYHEDVNKEEDRARQSGWSLNETAKVLEKHRSIFGDSGQKVSTEQIRELANEPVLTSTRQDGSPKRKVPSDEKKKDSPASRNAPPRILSQIPIAKDIKTELKRNRISSRERKSVYTRETIIEKSSSRKSIERTKSYEMRSSRTEDSSSTKKRTTETTSKSRANSQEESTTRKKSFARGASMDSVKNYVVQNFVGMTSLDELQSPSYVEKVQEVIDETSSVIKEKVEALRRGAAAAKVKKDSSSSSEEHSSGRRASSRRNSRDESNDNKASLEREASEESKSSLPAVRPPSSKSTSRSLSSARSEPDAAGLTLPPISPESAKSPKDKKEELVLPVLSPPRTAAAAVASVEDAVSMDDTTAAVEEIAEDATASSSERMIEDMVVEDVEDAEEKIEAAPEETAEENLVVEEAKIDEKTMESVAEIVVPSEEKLVPPAEVADEKPVVPPIEIKEEKPVVPPIEINDEKDAQSTVVTQQQVHEEIVSSTEVITHEKIEEFITIEKQVSSSEQIVTEEASSMDLLAVKEEEFHDSLNVTPEPFDTKGQRPDSLENSLAEEDAASSGHASPLQEPTLRDKLLEIEEAQRRIEDVLDETKTTNGVGEKIADKLIEIQESERRIEQILDAQSTGGSEVVNSDIKNKLQELEEAERRIESIFAKEEATTIEIDNAEETKKESEREEETNEKNLSVPVDPEKLEESPSRAISPHSYILTEGSPYEIPASVTTVIIPERTPSPDSESLLRVEVEVEDATSSVNDEAFGEAVTAESATEPSTVGIDYIRGIKAASHDMMLQSSSSSSREKNLDRIKEESAVDSEDERVLRVVTSSLEEILEKEELEYVQANSLESTTARSGESLTTTTTTKETSVTTDPSVDAALLPRVPELNLDSLADLTISSLNLTSDSPSDDKEKEAEELPPTVADSETETREFEKLEQRLELQSATAASSDIGAPAADINNAVCARGQEAKEEEEAVVAEKESENNATQPQSQCTVEPISGSIDGNEGDHADERKACHIYVPEASASKDDASSSSETSTFMSAATKIQAGVRGFLTRRRLQSTQKRSSTLDSVPSIQESFAVETTVPSLMPIVETTSEASKSRKKLRREDAVQRTTLSVENAFAENQLQHTGEFHDCIPLPVFDSEALSLKSVKERHRSETSKKQVNEVEHLLEKILLGHAATNFAAHPKLVDVVLLQGADAELQSKYLNFITSVEDVFGGGGDPPETPKGVIIEEITSSASLEETTSVKKPSPTNDEETTVASMSTSEEPLSINIEEVLGLGEEDESASRNRLNVGVKLGSQILSVSQDSPVMSDEHGGARSPVTMMQIAQPRSVDDKSEENNPT